MTDETKMPGLPPLAPGDTYTDELGTFTVPLPTLSCNVVEDDRIDDRLETPDEQA